ncbi:UNVERIFIED_ORG: MYXO-CTERM domain-containing protein [Arthrobacter sp. UYEF13]
MKRTLATLGVMGLGLISLTAPAVAAPNMVIVCHDGAQTGTGWGAIQLNVNGLNGHDGHPTDIIPPNTSVPGGLNWTNAGKITYIANCAPLPPGEEPPVYPPVDPPVVVVDPPVVVVDPPVVVVDPPVVVVDPPVVVVDPPVLVPPAVVETPVVESSAVVQTPVTTATPTVQTPAAAATVQTPAGTGTAAVSQGTNQGFNAQTSVGGAESAPTWLMGLGVMLGAGALVAVRRRSLEPKAD